MYNRTSRLRVSRAMRKIVRENTLSMDDIIYPLFIVEGENIKTEIPSMKNQYHLSVDQLEEEIHSLVKIGVHSVLLFGTPKFKDDLASEAYNENGIVQKAIREIKRIDSEMLVMTDVCLCQYKSDGHCCIFNEKGNIMGRHTLELLDKIALSHVRAGADVVAPSDMMDGRIQSIRRKLNESGFEHVAIMSYSAKYASNYYGPFRDAVHSAPSFGDRKSYQMDMANAQEAVKEMAIDLEEGADILMVKPAGPYSDIIRMGKDRFDAPMAAYQVSGEYSMLRNAVDQNVVSEMAIYESLMGLKRSGAKLLITYFAKDLPKLIEEANKNV